MSNEPNDKGITRRDFMRYSTAAAAGAALGIPAITEAGAPQPDPAAPKPGPAAPKPGPAAPKPGPAAPDPRKTRSYNEQMEYRRLGRTNLMVSVISLGGHWKKIPYSFGTAEFKKNRADVISACIDHGINLVDIAAEEEVQTYAEALRGRREKMYFAYSCNTREGRVKEYAGSLDKMKEGFKQGLKEAGLEYVDIWRLMLQEQTGQMNTPQEIEVVMQALDWAKAAGLARHTGISSHDRSWIAEAVAKHPQLEVVVTPYTADSKEKPEGSMFDAIKKHDVGFIGIKPFASGSVFKSKGQPDSSTKEEDDRRARMVLRYVLSCDVLSATIPGLVTIDQLKNAVAAVRERRQFEVAEAEDYRRITGEMWANLPPDYHWLRDWEYV
jgi:aryl-alcohol dehydrogenase-like predicted oxidoreductase